MAQHITFADLKGLRTPALKRIHTAARDAVIASGLMDADSFDAANERSARDNVSLGFGADRARAFSALTTVSQIGGKVERVEPSQQTLTEGGFMQGQARWNAGNGLSIARGILASA